MSYSLVVLYDKDGVNVRVGIDESNRLNIELRHEDDEQSFDIYLPPDVHEELFEYLRRQ